MPERGVRNKRPSTLLDRNGEIATASLSFLAGGGGGGRGKAFQKWQQKGRVDRWQDVTKLWWDGGRTLNVSSTDMVFSFLSSIDTPKFYCHLPLDTTTTTPQQRHLYVVRPFIKPIKQIGWEIRGETPKSPHGAAHRAIF